MNIVFNCSYITFVFPDTEITTEIVIHDIFHLQTKNTSWKNDFWKLVLLSLFPTAVLFVIHLHISSRLSLMNITHEIYTLKKK